MPSTASLLGIGWKIKFQKRKRNLSRENVLKFLISFGVQND